MYKVLVVDDEQWIRKWLVKMIPSLRSDLVIANACDNGEEALAEIQKGNIDIVVSDIRMPLLSGLDLITAVKEHALSTKFILVSGYDEFEYAKKAIKCGVIDYLLKPIEKDELQEALDKAISKIEIEKKGKSNPEFVNSTIYKILRSYILDKEETELIKIKDICNSNNIHYDFIRIGILQPNMVLQSKSSINEVLMNSIEHKLLEDQKFVIFADSLNYVLVILHKGPVEGLEVFFTSLKREIERVDGEKIAKLEMSPWFKEIESLPFYYKDLMGNLKQSVIKKREEIQNEKETLSLLHNDLLRFITSHDYEGLQKYVEKTEKDDFFLQLDVDKFRLMLFNLMSDIIKQIENIHTESNNDLVNKGYDFCVKVYNYSNFNAMLDWVSQYSEEVIHFLSQNELFNVTQIVKQIYKQMQIDFGKDLNLSWVSEMYKINSSYFSKKFKEQIGENFVDCLTKFRIDAAKRLLSNTDKPIKEIGCEVGFKDPKYFSKVFAFNVKQSPSSYRINMRRQG